LGAISEGTGGEGDETEDVAAKGGQMLNLIAGDAAALTFTASDVVPTSSLTLMVLGCSGMIVTPFRVLVENPWALTMRMKVLAGRALKV
jgi:hypothetical protein